MNISIIKKVPEWARFEGIDAAADLCTVPHEHLAVRALEYPEGSDFEPLARRLLGDHIDPQNPVTESAFPTGASREELAKLLRARGYFVFSKFGIQSHHRIDRGIYGWCVVHRQMYSIVLSRFTCCKITYHEVQFAVRMDVIMVF